ncbi:MAG: hypothetical protein WCF95_07875, partial [bacterium]
MGLDFSVAASGAADTTISASDGKKLVLADGLFRVPLEHWLKPASLPLRPLANWPAVGAPLDLRLVSGPLPVLYGRPLTGQDGRGFLDLGEREVHCGIDILGSCFFMLTRYEEVAKPEQDIHGRYPVSAALAFQEGFLRRPIVNEYLELLWACLHHLWPQLQRKERQYRLIPTHDLDLPLSVAGKAWPHVLQRVAGDLLRRREVGLSYRRLAAKVKSYFGDFDSDPNNTFDFLLDLHEARGLQSRFFFLAGHTGGMSDGDYPLSLPWMRRLLRRLSERGSSIGLHCSYDTIA